MNKRCIGCGAILQSTDKTKPGYIEKALYDKDNYCQRCYKIIHYNEKYVTHLPNINEHIIKEVNAKAKYAYFLIDFLNLNNETLSNFKKITVPKTLVISKIDIIPKEIKRNKIIDYLKKIYEINDKIIFLSTKKNISVKSILSNIITNNLDNTFILGYTNAGKSTFINAILKESNIENKNLTTSLIPNTTMDFVTLNINGINIVDSPGFTYEKTIYKENEFDLIKRIHKTTFIKPTTFQLKKNASILIEDKIILNSTEPNNYTLYISNNVKVERTFKKPVSKFKPIELEIPNDSDLVIKSLGFINIKKRCKITLYIEEKDLIEVRKSIFRREV